MIPIDHSLSIPDSLEIYSYDICWMDWDQAHVKFSKDSLEYLKKLDILKDIKTLDCTFNFRSIWLRNIRITGTLLKKGAQAGLTPFQICSILCRDDDFDDDPEPSLLETLVNKAQEMAKSIRKIRKSNHQTKLDSVENFRKRKYKTSNSLKENSLKVINDITNNREDQFIKNFFSWETKKDYSSNKIDLIKINFDSYEGSSENDTRLMQFPNISKQKS